MRRTYKSKKNTGRGLDHRDMVYNMDEKSSAFDAFYIQNIKQTKREQSCMGSSNNYGAASNRVSKRKYVKRLVKEVEPPPIESLGESISGSVFLTPDKSIRVNKAPDLFDQLLNSSPACLKVKQMKKIDPFDQVLVKTPKKTKTYNRKKKLLNKFNYSSNEISVSDKENSYKGNENSNENITDLRAHELVIEKVTTPIPKMDESINNIVRKLSIINNINSKRSSSSLKKTFKCNKNRLTKNFQSPLVKTSPLSSTPFMDKIRSKSIYKFSPIPMGELEKSPNYVTIMEDDNEVNKSIVFVPKKSSNALKRSNTESPVTQCKGNSHPLFSSEVDTLEDLSKDTKVSKDRSPFHNAENRDLICVDVIALSTTDMEPFLGFSNETIADMKKDDSIIISTGKVSKSNQTSKEICVDNETIDSKREYNTKTDLHSSDIEYSVPPEPFHGFTKQSDSIISISAADDSMPSQPFLGFINVETSHNESNDIDRNVFDKQENKSAINIFAVENKVLWQTKLNRVTPKIDEIVDSDDDDDEEQNDFVINTSAAESEISKEPESYENIENTLKRDKYVKSVDYDQQQQHSDKDDDTALSSFSSQSEQDSADCDHQISQSKDSDKNDDTALSSFSSLSEQDNQIVNECSLEELEDEYYHDKQSIKPSANNCALEEKDDEYNDNRSSNQSVNDCSIEEEYDDKESFYDTCNSDSSLGEENIHKEPVVTLERMDMDLFKKYFKSMPLDHSKEPQVVIERINVDLFKKYDDTISNYNEDEEMNSKGHPSEDVSENYASFEDSDSNFDELSEQNSQSTNAETDITYSTESDSNSCSHETSSGNKDRSIGEKCVNFVTTRRRNDFTNDSQILVMDGSQDSNSTECDRTVLSNKKVSLNNPDPNKQLNNTFEGTNDKCIPTEEDVVETDLNQTKSPDTRLSNVTTRNSKIFKISNCYETINVSKTPESKPGIMLQPGKKWERSLSIYRRMTTNDNYEHSILEDEDLQSKGRKYRQSVICTMEMQEKSLLHNESINNRRSTFVSKPSRSTIRIVKEANTSQLSLSSTAVFEDLKGFLEDCDDTIVELSKLSLVDDHDVTVIEKFHEASRIATARDYVFRRCNQSDTIPFDECYPDPLLKNCRKIGEGVYGEVFLWRAPDGRARVMKVVPIAGTVKVNGEHQKDFHEVIAEIVIAMELSALRAPIAEIDCHFNEGKDVDALDLHSVENATDVFNEVLAVRCVYGSYPSRLLDLWELYDETKGSENDNPAILPVDQQYIVLELANAGQDLESYQFNGADQAHALFLQVAFALAVGEESFQFEHRDLHWGNVLIAPTDQKYATFVLRGRCHRVARRGVAATIIDYSLSRVSLAARGAERAALYNDLAADDGLFGALGDYQFEVYRLMRDKLGNDWKNFEPYTNILWLHYTVDKMITALRYKRTTTKIHKQFINKLKGIKERILGYGSAAQFVLTDNEF